MGYGPAPITCSLQRALTPIIRRGTVCCAIVPQPIEAHWGAAIHEGEGSIKKIDIFSHVLPTQYLEAIRRHADEKFQPMVRRFADIRALWDIDTRVSMMAQWPDLQQVLTLSLPAPELIAGPELSPELARIANDGMAEIRDRRSDRFPAFVASLPMNNVPAALEEMDRAVTKLGARGIQLLTSVEGRPLDHPKFFPVLERITKQYGLPIWLHPFREASVPDYATETRSEYEVWVVLGWPHESSVAMARIVFSEMFERLPDLEIITHHCGATIPYLVGRVGPMWDEFGLRSGNADYVAIRARMSKSPLEYFCQFYADTAIGGSTAALRCGLDFFGASHVLFGTDCPFGPEGGMWFLRENIRALDTLDLPAGDRQDIYFRNALKLMRLE